LPSLCRDGRPSENAERAARDLGAGEWQVLTLVSAPMLLPALAAAFFLSVTFSWDEFIIAFLLTRFDVTLPVEIWSMLKSGLSPATNAVGSLVFLVSSPWSWRAGGSPSFGGAQHDRSVDHRGREATLGRVHRAGPMSRSGPSRRANSSCCSARRAAARPRF
jgi:hypothetical protein